MSNRWVSFLAVVGDPIEKEGIYKHKFDELFPNYSEFWAKYVQPNRDPNDPSKLRVGFPQEIENIINNHYGVFYHLTVAYRQIGELSNPVLDIGDPLYHLATTIDLVERTFAAALKVRGELDRNPIYVELTKEEFDKRVSKYWLESYSQVLKKFERNFQPVSINFHNVSDIFTHQVLETQAKKKFQAIANRVRQYRNVLTHSLPPLKLEKNGVKYLPRQNFLHLYRDGNWSSGRDSINYDHYAPAVEIISELARELIKNINNLWDSLLEIMRSIRVDSKYSDQIVDEKKLFTSPESGISPSRVITEGEFYTGGTAVLHVPTTGYIPQDLPPSGEWGNPAITKKPNEPDDL